MSQHLGWALESTWETLQGAGSGIKQMLWEEKNAAVAGLVKRSRTEGTWLEGIVATLGTGGYYLYKLTPLGAPEAVAKALYHGGVMIANARNIEEILLGAASILGGIGGAAGTAAGIQGLDKIGSGIGNMTASVVRQMGNAQILQAATIPTGVVAAAVVAGGPINMAMAAVGREPDEGEVGEDDLQWMSVLEKKCAETGLPFEDFVAIALRWQGPRQAGYMFIARAKYLTSKGRHSGAAKAFEKASEMYERVGETMAALSAKAEAAKSWAGIGNRFKAAEILEEISRRYLEHGHIEHAMAAKGMLADQYMRMNRLDEAINLARAVQEHPLSPSTFKAEVARIEGISLARKGEMDVAVVAYQKICDHLCNLDKVTVEGYAELATSASRVSFHAKRFGEALLDIRLAKSLYSLSGDVKKFLGASGAEATCLLEMGRSSEVLKLIHAILPAAKKLGGPAIVNALEAIERMARNATR